MVEPGEVAAEQVFDERADGLVVSDGGVQALEVGAAKAPLLGLAGVFGRVRDVFGSAQHEVPSVAVGGRHNPVLVRRHQDRRADLLEEVVAVEIASQELGRHASQRLFAGVAGQPGERGVDVD